MSCRHGYYIMFRICLPTESHAPFIMPRFRDVQASRALDLAGTLVRHCSSQSLEYEIETSRQFREIGTLSSGRATTPWVAPFLTRVAVPVPYNDAYTFFLLFWSRSRCHILKCVPFALLSIINFTCHDWFLILTRCYAVMSSQAYCLTWFLVLYCRLVPPNFSPDRHPSKRPNAQTRWERSSHVWISLLLVSARHEQCFIWNTPVQFRKSANTACRQHFLFWR